METPINSCKKLLLGTSSILLLAFFPAVANATGEFRCDVSGVVKVSGHPIEGALVGIDGPDSGTVYTVTNREGKWTRSIVSEFGPGEAPKGWAFKVKISQYGTNGDRLYFFGDTSKIADASDHPTAYCTADNFGKVRLGNSGITTVKRVRPSSGSNDSKIILGRSEVETAPGVSDTKLHIDFSGFGANEDLQGVAKTWFIAETHRDQAIKARSYRELKNLAESTPQVDPFSLRTDEKGSGILDDPLAPDGVYPHEGVTELCVRSTTNHWKTCTHYVLLGYKFDPKKPSPGLYERVDQLD